MPHSPVLQPEDMFQPNLFESKAGESDFEKVVLAALGDFQARRRELVGRPLALDRLRGAFDRACHRLGVAEFSDEEIVQSLSNMGATVETLPSYSAKRPYRITTGSTLAEQAREFFEKLESGD